MIPKQTVRTQDKPAPGDSCSFLVIDALGNHHIILADPSPVTTSDRYTFFCGRDLVAEFTAPVAIVNLSRP